MRRRRRGHRHPGGGDPVTAAVGLRNVFWGVKGAAGSLDGLSLSVAGGECLLIAGAPGSGKAALLRLIARDLPPQSGAVCLFSRDIWLMSVQEVAGMVTTLSPAETAFDGLTPRQILGAACRARQAELSPAARSAAVHAALRQVGLGMPDDPLFGALPPEGRLRVLAARALLLRPRIVLVPGVDAGALHLLIGLLAGLRDAGATVVATMEDMGAATGPVDRVVRLDRGRITADSAACPA